MKYSLWTIGHNNYDAEKFLNFLGEHSVVGVVDARRYPLQ